MKKKDSGAGQLSLHFEASSFSEFREPNKIGGARVLAFPPRQKHVQSSSGSSQNEEIENRIIAKALRRAADLDW